MDEGEVIERGLRAGVKALGLELDEAQISALYGYHAFLMKTNKELNLTGHKDAKSSLVNNLLNSLGPWRQIHPTKPSADVGSGGGFPGIPLAIALKMPRFTLIDSKQKKCNFLKEACKRFAPQVNVVCGDINEITTKYQQIMFCGFGTLKKILHVSGANIAFQGRIIAWKGAKARIDEEIAECSPSKRNWERVRFTVPGLEAERYLCVWKP